MMPNGESSTQRVKRVLIESLHLEGISSDSIDNDEALFGDRLGLDSVDALELVVALEKEYGVRIDSEQMDREDFASIASLARFVEGLEERQRTGSSGLDD